MQGDFFSNKVFGGCFRVDRSNSVVLRIHGIAFRDPGIWVGGHWVAYNTDTNHTKISVLTLNPKPQTLNP